MKKPWRMERLNRRSWRFGLFIGLCLWESPFLMKAPSADSASYRWILPSSAHCAGRGNSFWTTDLILGNLGDSEASVLLKFHSGLGDGNTLEKQLVLPPHSSQHYHDVLASVLGLESGFGALHAVATQAEITVSSQTSTAAEEGRYGQSVPGFSSSDWIIPGSPRQLCALQEDKDFRTNLVLANATAQALEVEARLFSADGRLIGKSLYLLSGWEMLQRNRVLAEIAPQETALTNARLELATSTLQGAFVAYASVIDNVTQDPRTVLPQWGLAPTVRFSAN